MAHDEFIDKLIHLFDAGSSGDAVNFLMRSGDYNYSEALDACDFIIRALIKQKHRKACIQCPHCGSHIEPGWQVCRRCGQALDWSREK